MGDGRRRDRGWELVVSTRKGGGKRWKMVEGGIEGLSTRNDKEDNKAFLKFILFFAIGYEYSQGLHWLCTESHSTKTE